MDRQIVYPGAIPRSVDILTIEQSTMKALGYLIQMAFGAGTYVDGLTLSATGPASMAVKVGTGSLISLQEIDPNSFGSLSADTNPLMKMGILAEGATSFTLTAPTTSGQSINYLIEAAFSEADGTAVTLPYYNAANPNQPYSGPSNSGTPQNTQRLQTVALQLKAGAPAAAGTQTTPAVDSGNVGLYIITVNFGQSTVTSSSWTTYPTAPFINVKIPQLRMRLTANLNLYVNGSGGNDNNNGLSMSTALATLQGAWNAIIDHLDLNGYSVTVNVASGTYAGVACIGQPLGATGGINNVPGGPGPSVSFVGDTTTPTNVTVSAASANCFQATNGAQISVAGFFLEATGVSVFYSQAGAGLYAFAGGGIVFDAINFGACSVSHIISTIGSIVESKGNPYTISGGSATHITAFDFGYVTCANSTVTLTGTPAFTTGFCLCDVHGNAFMPSITFTGSATGPRFNVSGSSIISTGSGANPTYFPGSSAGTADGTTFGLYT